MEIAHPDATDGKHWKKNKGGQKRGKSEDEQENSNASFLSDDDEIERRRILDEEEEGVFGASARACERERYIYIYI